VDVPELVDPEAAAPAAVLVGALVAVAAVAVAVAVADPRDRSAIHRA
jgi:hypothetical protein